MTNEVSLFERGNLTEILYGACFLGSGGGGPFAGGELLLKYMIENFPQGVSCITPAVISEASWGSMVAGLGSPDAAEHMQAPFTRAPKQVFEQLANTQGKSFSCVIPGEVGAMNSFIPMLVAAQLGIPVLDGDGAGRAIPELTVSAFAGQVSIDPMIMANETSDPSNAISLTMNIQTAEQADEMARGIVEAKSFGEVGALATWAMDGSKMKEVVIPGTLSLAQQVGSALLRANGSGDAAMQLIQQVLGTRMFSLFKGSIIDVSEQTGGGFDSGQVVLKNATGETCVIYNLNENMIAWSSVSSQPLAMGPDSICYLRSDAMPLSNAEIDQSSIGWEVNIIGIQAAPQMRATAVVSAFEVILQQMGYAGTYVPIEQLHL